MSTRLFPHAYHSAILSTDQFVCYSFRFLGSWKHDFRYHVHSYLELITKITQLPHLINDLFAAQISGANREQLDLLRKLVEDNLQLVEERLDRISCFLPAIDRGWQTDLEEIWRLFYKVNQEMVLIVGRNIHYSFDLDEKLHMLYSLKADSCYDYEDWYSDLSE
ncbi:hypothetical protein [Paenibacillus glycanilyticus]|uniref:hypothetical protein n=1 Tax=Paenibacillus glycanilyticus TaxID=126569 RepID=UPI003EBFB987